ncbi:MAG: TldD/PmbA family protein [Bacteroidales bacterium]
MNNKERIELAQWAAKIASKHGATATAIAISRSRSVSVEVREQKLETIRESTDNSLSLQVYRDNKYSGHSTNNLNKNDLERFIREAVEATQYLAADPDRMLPDPSLYPTDLSEDLQVNDPQQGTVTPEHRVAVAMQTEQLAREAGAEILSASASFNDSFSEGIRLHSNGFEGTFASTSFSTGASLTVMDNGSRPAGGFYARSRFLQDLPAAEAVAQQAIFQTLRQMGQSSIASGQYTMLLENRVAASLLGRIFQPMSARSIQQKNSFLLDMLGQQIGSDKLTIIDDPTIKGGFASRHFDGEGIAARKRTLIDKGVLQAYLIDNYYGRKLGMTPNGGSTSNILMEYGARNQDQIVAATNKGILVTSFNGGNSNPTTGDFSFGISGQLIENGKIVRPVNEMNISGNFKNLMHQLIETGNDPNPYSSAKTPTLAFRDVDFAGL